jgi:hypothetical protein
MVPNELILTAKSGQSELYERQGKRHGNRPPRIRIRRKKTNFRPQREHAEYYGFLVVFMLLFMTIDIGNGFVVSCRAKWFRKLYEQSAVGTVRPAESSDYRWQHRNICDPGSHQCRRRTGTVFHSGICHNLHTRIHRAQNLPETKDLHSLKSSTRSGERYG